MGLSQSADSQLDQSLCTSVNDVLRTEEGCYQNMGTDITYQEAEFVCSTELEGRLMVRDESVGDVRSFLSSQLSYREPGMNSSWWVGGGTDTSCGLVSPGAVTVTEADCTGVSQALCYLGLQCDPASQEVVGGEGCQCGCGDGTAQPQPWDCQTCWEGEFCYDDTEFQAQYCVAQCGILPTTNTWPCFCQWEVCDNYGYNYCNATGCQEFDSCPVSPYDLLLSSQSLCNCWEGGLCNNTEFCHYDQTITTSSTTSTSTSTSTTSTTTSTMYSSSSTSTYMTMISPYSCVVRPEECPEVPHLSPPGGCTCNQTELCPEGLMCDPSLPPTNSSCIERPQPCQPFPAFAGPEGCLCNLTGLTLSPEICEEDEACGEACFLPAFCDHPGALDNWTEYNARLVSESNETSFIQWSRLDLECLEHTFTDHSVLSGDFQTELTAVCNNNGTWDLPACVFPACAEPQVDTQSVEVKEMLIIDKATTQGAMVKFSCKDQTTEFTFGSFTRLLAVCNRTLWEVSHPAACPDQSTECLNLQELSCSFTGCAGLAPPQERVVHTGLTQRFITGASVTASCSHDVDQFSVLESWSEPGLVMSVTSPQYSPQYPATPRWCPHPDCLPASGLPWRAANISARGPDCVEEAGYGWAAWCLGDPTVITRTADNSWDLSQDICEY